MTSQSSKIATPASESAATGDLPDGAAVNNRQDLRAMLNGTRMPEQDEANRHNGQVYRDRQMTELTK